MSPVAKLLRLLPLLALGSAFAISPRDPEIYFSRSDPVEQVIVRQIDGAKKSIHMLMYAFTDDKFSAALLRAARRGVDVKIVFDKSQTEEKHSLGDDLLEKLGPTRVEFRTGKGRGIMHEKMAIYDGTEVSLGSFNWTDNARDNNWENIIFLHDPQLALACEREFQRVWSSKEPK
jgi:phosphatidylserine/phosphatidylglycerophosphate/cardiolipin synthase-like enzyme